MKDESKEGEGVKLQPHFFAYSENLSNPLVCMSLAQAEGTKGDLWSVKLSKPTRS